MLLRTLMARVRDEPRVCSMVPIPDEADEEARRAYRERWTGPRTTIDPEQDRRHSGDARCERLSGLAKYRREQLALLRQPDGDPVPLAAWVRIERLLARLELILRQIKEVEAARDAVLKKPAPADEAEGMIRSLVDMRAIAPNSRHFSCARLSHGRSPIVGRSDPMLDSSGHHFPAAEASANKGSARTGTDVCERRWWNSPGPQASHAKDGVIPEGAKMKMA
jgi:hypothetical protein